MLTITARFIYYISRDICSDVAPSRAKRPPIIVPLFINLKRQGMAAFNKIILASSLAHPSAKPKSATNKKLFPSHGTVPLFDFDVTRGRQTGAYGVAASSSRCSLDASATLPLGQRVPIARSRNGGPPVWWLRNACRPHLVVLGRSLQGRTPRVANRFAEDFLFLSDQLT